MIWLASSHNRQSWIVRLATSSRHALVLFCWLVRVFESFNFFKIFFFGMWFVENMKFFLTKTNAGNAGKTADFVPGPVLSIPQRTGARLACSQWLRLPPGLGGNPHFWWVFRLCGISPSCGLIPPNRHCPVERLKATKPVTLLVESLCDSMGKWGQASRPVLSRAGQNACPTCELYSNAKTALTRISHQR